MDIHTGFIENEKEKRNRIVLWELMRDSLVGAEVLGLCNTVPVPMDVYYLYEKVKEWANNVNYWDYFRLWFAIFADTVGTEQFPTVDELFFHINQKADRIDYVGQLVGQDTPLARYLVLPALIVSLLKLHTKDEAERNFLQRLVLQLSAEAEKLGKTLTAEAVIKGYKERKDGLRSIDQTMMLLGQHPASTTQAAKGVDDVDPQALVAGLAKGGRGASNSGGGAQKGGKSGTALQSVSDRIGKATVDACIASKICVLFQVGECIWRDCKFHHVIYNQSGPAQGQSQAAQGGQDGGYGAPPVAPGGPSGAQGATAMSPQRNTQGTQKGASTGKGGRPSSSPSKPRTPAPQVFVCTRCKGVNCPPDVTKCYTVMCGNCGFPGHHHTQCTSETHDPQALVTVVEKGALLRRR